MLNIPRFAQEEAEAGLCLDPGHTGCPLQPCHERLGGYLFDEAGFKRPKVDSMKAGFQEGEEEIKPSLVQHLCARGRILDHLG